MPNSITSYIAFLSLAGILSVTVATQVYAADNPTTSDSDTGDKIYKKTGPGGEVDYSDKPSPDSQEIDLPKGSEYKPVMPPAGFKPYQPPAKPRPVTINNSVTITSPEDKGAMWSASGELTISVSLGAALASGQQLEYLVDGKVMYTGSETSHTFTDLYRGTHVLTVRIVDQQGQASTSAPVTFTLHRPHK